MAQEPKFSSPEQLEALVDEYLASDKVLMMSGLCVHLRCSRECLNRYQQGGAKASFTPEQIQQFSDIIKRAKERMAEYWCEGMVEGRVPVATGIFMLKNLGYTDQQTITQKHEITGGAGEVLARLAAAQAVAKKAGGEEDGG